MLDGGHMSHPWLGSLTPFHWVPLDLECLRWLLLLLHSSLKLIPEIGRQGQLEAVRWLSTWLVWALEAQELQPWCGPASHTSAVFPQSECSRMGGRSCPPLKIWTQKTASVTSVLTYWLLVKVVTNTLFTLWFLLLFVSQKCWLILTSKYSF